MKLVKTQTPPAGLRPFVIASEAFPKGEEAMEVVYERCCGLDVHKKTVVACVLVTETAGQMQRHIRTFSTMTAGLLALADWLESMSVTVVALESTGVYWRPVFNEARKRVARSSWSMLST